jgi:hypothetical protein
MVLFAIVAEPVEKPDARFLALDYHSPPTLVSQSISLDFPILSRGGLRVFCPSRSNDKNNNESQPNHFWPGCFTDC